MNDFWKDKPKELRKLVDDIEGDQNLQTKADYIQAYADDFAMKLLSRILPLYDEDEKRYVLTEFKKTL